MRSLRSASVALLLAGCSGQNPPAVQARSDATKADTSVPVVFVVAPAPRAARSTSPDLHDAWSGCVDQEIRRREVDRAPTASLSESTAAVAQACRHLYPGVPGQDALAIHLAINGVRAQTTSPPLIRNTRRAAPARVDGGKDAQQ